MEKSVAHSLDTDGIAGSHPTPARWLSRALLAGFYAFAGLLHLTQAQPFLTILPSFVPFPAAVIIGTGLCELAGAAAILSRPLRRAAGWCLAAYAICVFPANITHALLDLHRPDNMVSLFYHGPRLVLQPVIVWWTLYAGGIVTWPMRSPGPSE